MQRDSKSLTHFDPFAANLQTGELWKQGKRIHLQTQPFEILKVLLERPNELVTREELQRKLWPSDTFVDFDQGLNKAVNKLRDALGDTVDDPKFIETVPKRGYRFIAPVVADAQPVSPQLTSGAPAAAPAKAGFQIRWPAVVLILFFLGLTAWFVHFEISKGAASESNDLRSIAVLPFTTQGNGSDYDIADGLTDSIINDLSLVPDLRVISHASVFQYRGQTVEPKAVGQRLGVATLLEGRVLQAGTTLTVQLELISVSDGRHLWGQEYTRSINQGPALSQDVAGAIAEVLRLRLVPGANSRQAATDAEANQLYLKGRYYFFKETQEDVLHARELFREAIDRDPAFALAYSALGDSYDWMATEGYQPIAEVAPQAIAAKTRANALNGSLAEVHASLASLEFVQWNWANAEIEFQRAINLNPNYFEAHRLYSIYLRTMKRYPEAILHAKLCDQLNPLLMPAKSHLALTYYYARDYDAAAAQYRLMFKDDPKSAGAHAGLAAVLLRQGKQKEGIEEWQKALTLAGDEASAKTLGGTYARSGLRAAQNELLRSELQSLRTFATSNYVSPVEFAARYAQLEDKDAAFRWLEKAFADRSPQLFNLNGDPDYDSLRSDPRFSSLLARLHLPQ